MFTIATPQYVTSGGGVEAVVEEELHNKFPAVTKAQLLSYASDWVKGLITKAQLLEYARLWVSGG